MTLRGSLTSNLALLESSRPERCCLKNQGAHFLRKDIRNLRLASHTHKHMVYNLFGKVNEAVEPLTEMG